MSKYDRSTFYVAGSTVGYIDCPFYEEAKEKSDQLVPVEVPAVA